MKWPWVSRARLEAKEQECRDWSKHASLAYGESDRWAAAHSQLSLRYDALLEKFTALRLAGAVVPEPMPLPIERKRDPCADAIMAKAGRDTALQALMFKQLAKDRAEKKMTEDEILVAIQTGEPPDVWSMPT